MMRLVIDNQQIACIRHFTENVADVSLIAQSPALVHALSFCYLFIRLPCQRVPVADKNFPLAKLFLESNRNDIEQIVIIARRIWDKNLQSLKYSQPRCDDQNIF